MRADLLGQVRALAAEQYGAGPFASPPGFITSRSRASGRPACRVLHAARLTARAERGRRPGRTAAKASDRCA
jgi:hypothetical protein